MTRVALVTGGTRGIGAAVSALLHQNGYRVAANFARNQTQAHKFSSEYHIAIYQWDVSDYVACQQAITQVQQELGPVDILVNNAGITRDTPLHRMTPEQWDEVINTNLNSAFYMTRAVIEGMRQRLFGRIVNMSSVNAQSGQAGQCNYTAAKAGLLGLTKSLALEGASKGITVNAITPGYTDTEMVRAVAPPILEKIIARVPLGRLATPDEIAHAVLFLVSEEAGYITGATLDVNGGLYRS